MYLQELRDIMALYTNNNPQSAIGSVEFSPTLNGNSAFFHLKEDADPQAIKKWLKDQGQQIAAETPVGNHTILVTRGDKTQEEMLSLLKGHGDDLIAPETKEKVSLWKLRGWASMIGQPLQLISGFLQKGTPDAATIGFATSNIIANITNIIFGAQKETDLNHLYYLKNEINTRLSPYLPEGAEFLDINDTRSKLHKEPEKKTVGGKVYDFMKRYSVIGGEIGLRYIGAAMLAFPLKKPSPITKELSYEHWKNGFGQLGRGEFKDAYKTLSNSDNATRYAGLAYMGGKTIALTTKIPDPYNTDKKHTWVDTFREKVVFRASSIIETCAAAIITLDRLNLVSFQKDKVTGEPLKRTLSAKGIIRQLQENKKEVPKWLNSLDKTLEKTKPRDWLGGIGGALFTGGLIIRIFAPFGSKEVDMNELDAHTTDTLAMVPPEKLPQAIAETAAFLTDHFKKKNLVFSQVYTQLANDLYKYHHIALPNAEGGMGPMVAEAHTPEPDPETKTFARPEMQKPSPATLPRPGSYQDLANASNGATLSRA